MRVKNSASVRSAVVGALAMILQSVWNSQVCVVRKRNPSPTYQPEEEALLQHACVFV